MNKMKLSILTLTFIFTLIQSQFTAPKSICIYLIVRVAKSRTSRTANIPTGCWVKDMNLQVYRKRKKNYKKKNLLPNTKYNIAISTC